MEYYKLGHPKAYGGADSFSKKWLESQPAYTLHKPVKRRFKRNKYFSKGINDFWQADLADMSDFSKWNDGYKYLLVVIDVFTKFLWALPVKSKKPQEVLDAFKTIGLVPNLLMTDKGTEFRNRLLQRHFSGIKYYASNSPDVKASVAERVIRTLKTKIYRYLTHKGGKRYIDALQNLVDGYNRAEHRSTGKAPRDINKENENEVRNKLYPKPAVRQPKLQVGDHVRISLQRLTFQKGYMAQWSEEIFKIKQVLTRDPPVYRLVDYYEEEITGIFYEPELQRVEPIYRVEKILRRRRDQVLVKWLGYPKPTWEPVNNVL